MAKRAIALAMQNRWSGAIEANRAILNDFPEDIEACNRLGKALTEMGRYKEAKEAFQRAHEISPYNVIAKKNVDRLTQLGDEAPHPNVHSSGAYHTFIEESGKAGVTSLINLASPKVLLKMAPGYPVQLEVKGATLIVTNTAGEYLGQVEPKLASRLSRLMKAGNRYEATVTSIGEQELSTIIREVYQHASLAGVASFPSRGPADNRAYLPGTIEGYDLGDEDALQTDPAVVKDWSDDDTEPGDDDAYSPVVHRIINPAEEEKTTSGDEDF